MSIPVASPEVARLLSPYPHVAACPECRQYADDYLTVHSAGTVLVAVLNHHDSAHTSDRLGPGAAHF
jgi:hypothetical protein